MHPELGLPEVRKLWQTEGLFSDHYLKARLQKNSWWPSDAEAEPIWQFCKELYEKRYLACAKNNEAFTRQELLDKILEKLGFAWTDNLGLPDQDAEPDYILFSSAEEKEKVIEASKQQRYAASVGILEAKKVNHPLSQISKHQGRYPHQQIRDYLNEAQVLTWSILTNGNEWRLYTRDAKPSQFFGLNFEVAIKSLGDFKVFLALFSAAAFARDAQGKCRLDQIREVALATQAELEADLRARIFTIVEILANGFAERPENKITDADLARLYENCLIFLYRLLFILYAEGRLLLPVEPKSRKYYKQLSLARLLAPLKKFSEYDSQTQTRFYRDIHALCLVINGSDKKANDEFGVPRYNGGLFDPERYPLLKEWAVSDAVLADVLRQLMFTPEKAGQKFVPFESVDYADLSVQQLGSIYEGLLEHHFVRENGKLTLKTDKAERKATGTYYTPDYIVKYIVENTLGPLLREIEQRANVKAALKAGRQDNSFANEVLKLNVCDPAMGSGHFLVEATVYLADHVVYHSTTRFQAEFAKGESQEQMEISYWRRRVVEACIYGVDLNPLAVELAKLSLWLTTIASDQPLNFLDHHLCCGNSLIGARLEDLSHVPDKRRKSADSLKLSWKITENLRAALIKAVQMVHNIEGAASVSVSDVKNKEKLWLDSVRPALLPFRTVANLWTACFFGNDLPQEHYEALIELLDIHPDKIRPWKSAEEFQNIVTEALKKGSITLHKREFDINQLKNLCAFLIRSERSAKERRFFHWELEFPEVFFSEDGTQKENPGFDAVIGNPPWEKISATAPDNDFLDVAFAEIREGEINFYNLFVHHSHFLTGAGFLAGLLVPNTWLINKYGMLLRKFALTHFHTEEIFYLCKGVCPDAPDTIPVMLLSRKLRQPQPPPSSRKTSIKVVNDEMLGRSDFLSQLAWQDQAAEVVWFQRELHQMSVYDTERNYEFTKALESVSESLGKLAHASDGIYKSTVEEHKMASRQAESDKPVIESANQVSRYSVEWAGSFIPEALWKQHAALHKGDKIALHAARKPKLERRLVAGLTNDDLYFSNRFILVKLAQDEYAAYYILALLNSSALNKYFKIRFPITDVDGYMLHQLPIRRITFATPAPNRSGLLAKGKQLYERAFIHRDFVTSLNFVDEQLSAKPERADVIHDLLAFLAERMMELNKEKQTAAIKFLTDLKDFHDIEAHRLTPKTKLDEFWKMETPELFAHLHANKIKIKESDEEKIRSRFLKAKEQLIPLETQIRFTDELIDEIVYRLYGLTEDEIKIVKGT
jgi:type I restriction-modification system DNA methylase subunit